MRYFFISRDIVKIHTLAVSYVLAPVPVPLAEAVSAGFIRGSLC